MIIETPIIKLLKEKFPSAIISFHNFCNDDTIIIKKDYLKEIMQFLKNDKLTQFNMLIDITAVDYLGNEPRFEVVYHLLSIPLKQRLRIKIPLEENDTNIESITGIYPGANWFEREVYDMFGIKFLNHPNLKRLFMYDEFEGYPLRKDFPLKKQFPRIPMREIKTKY